MSERDPTHPGAPQRRTEEISIPVPVVTAGPIFTLSPEEIARFFVRVRRDQDTEHWDVRLDATLREILERANDFVPSDAGGILLDDPRAKLAGAPAPRLTYIAAFGSGVESVVGTSHPQRPRLRGTRLLDRAARRRPITSSRTTRCWAWRPTPDRCGRWSACRSSSASRSAACCSWRTAARAARTRRATRSCSGSSPRTCRRRSRTRSTRSGRARRRASTI